MSSINSISKASSSPEAFTYAYYKALLQSARVAGYEFCDLATIAKPQAALSLALRHDIDIDPAFALPVSEIEAELGIQATYFFLVESEFYSLVDSPDAARVIEQLLSSGHRLGLHYDGNGSNSEAEITDEVESQAQWLEQTFSTPVAAMSFHNPGLRPLGHLRFDHLTNAYSPEIFDDVRYLSDSNQRWRGNDPVAVIESGQHTRIQLLTHPFWWRESYSSMEQKLRDLASKLERPYEDVANSEQKALAIERGEEE